MCYYNIMKTYAIATTFGRFNLLHKGHVDLFEQMASQANKLVIGLSDGPKNIPWAFRCHIIRQALSHLDVELEITKCLQPFDHTALVVEMEPKNVVFYVGEDQWKLASAIERVYGWTTTRIKRLASSTLVRCTIENEDWDILPTLIPPHIVKDVIDAYQIEKELNEPTTSEDND